MTEPVGESELDRALNALKPIAQPADTPSVTPPGSDQRMAWDAVIAPDEEPAPHDTSTATAPPVSRFQFDLGSALSNLGDPSAPAASKPLSEPAAVVAPLETRRPPEPVPPTDPVARVDPAPPLEQRVRAEPGQPVPPLDQRRPVEARAETTREARVEPTGVPTAVPPLEKRRPAEPIAPETAPASPDVLDRRTPSLDPTHPAPRRTVFDEEASGAARAALHRVPLGSSIAEAAGMAMPLLPTAAAATPSAVPFEPQAVDVPTVSDVRAYRTAQQRASKRNSQGRLVGRVMLVLFLLGGVIGAALLFGRSFLFPTEWDPALTPIVDAIQLERGADFDDPIPLTVQSEAEYAATFARLVVPAGWESRVPEWRALGIASGEPTAETVAASLAVAQPALFDPESETILQLADAEGDRLEEALRAALEQGFEFQTGGAPADSTDSTPTDTAPTDAGAVGTSSDAAAVAGSFLGVQAQRTLVDRSLDDAFANRVLLAPGDDTTLPATADVPLPVAYDIVAAVRFGPAIAAAANGSSVDLEPGSYPDSVYAVFVPPGPTAALGAVLGEGESLQAPAIALSGDDLRLVLGSRLDRASTDAVVAATTANSYATFDRAGTTCFAMVFEFADGATAQSGIDGVNAWAGVLPAAAQAVAIPIDFTAVQVTGCDPGPADPVAVDASWVDEVIDGQLARL